MNTRYTPDTSGIPCTMIFVLLSPTTDTKYCSEQSKSDTTASPAVEDTKSGRNLCGFGYRVLSTMRLFTTSHSSVSPPPAEDTHTESKLSYYIRIHTYMHTYIHAFIHTYTYIHTYTHTYTYIHRYRLALAYSYIHLFTHVHTFIHTYIHTCERVSTCKQARQYTPPNR